MLPTGFLWAAKEQNIAQQLKSLPIFSQKTIDHQNCLKLSTDLYINLMEKGLDTTKARLVFILVNPYKRNVSKLTPNLQYLCYSSKTHWDWHSFLFFNGKAYDPFCSEFGIELNRYYETFWKKQKFTKNHLVYSVRMKDFSQIAGLTQSGRKAKIFGFAPITFLDYIKNPYHKSKKK
jgi:hypothetical protein